MRQSKIEILLNETLEIHKFEDYGPNGMQVEGDDREVKKVALAVSLTLEVIEQAKDWGADLILVHHGIYWKGQSTLIKGPFKKKIQLLLENGIAALAYHLPLDSHPELGNNALLAHSLGLEEIQMLPIDKGSFYGTMGIWPKGNMESLAAKVEALLGRKPTCLDFTGGKINKVAVVSGGAQSDFAQVIEAGADCYITGEISEHNYGTAQEWGKGFISAGHYASEQLGVKALGELLAKEAGVETKFFKTENPI